MAGYKPRTTRAKQLARVELRMPDEVKERIFRAAAIKGVEASEWMRGVLERSAKRVITTSDRS